MTPLLAHLPKRDRGFERLYQRHVADVYRYALAVLRSPHDAEDVTQTTFLNAYRAYERGERPRQPQNWLIAIAHNVCRQRFRQSARRPSEVAINESDGVTESFTEEEGPSAEDIRRALGHLSFNQRAALVMREIEGRSYAEIAEILDISVSAVETLIFRARRALREQLEGSLTCHEAELAISRQLDGRLPRGERGALRAHLRECRECAVFARSQRAQRTALRTALGLVPIPSSLTSLFGGAAAGTGVAAKAAAVVAAGALVGGAGYEGVKHTPWLDENRRPAPAAQPAPARPAAADEPGQPARSVAEPPGSRSPVAGARSTPKAKAKPRPRGKHAAGPGDAKPQSPPGQAKKQARTESPNGEKAAPPGHAKRAQPRSRAAPEQKRAQPKRRATPKRAQKPTVRLKPNLAKPKPVPRSKDRNGADSSPPPRGQTTPDSPKKSTAETLVEVLAPKKG